MRKFTLSRYAVDRQGSRKDSGTKTSVILDEKAIPDATEGITDLINLNAARFQLGEKPFTSLEKVPEGVNVAGSNADFGIVRKGNVLKIVPADTLPAMKKIRRKRMSDKEKIDKIMELRSLAGEEWCVSENKSQNNDEQVGHPDFGYRYDKAKTKTGWNRMKGK